MRFGKKLVAAAAASLMMIGSASADWNGLYAGTFFGANKTPMGGPVINMTFGAQAGFNFVPGNYLIGVAFEGGGAILAGTLFLQNVSASVRFGGFISPDVLLYGVVGFGAVFPYVSPIHAIIFGAGAELAIGTNLGVFGEIRRAHPPGGGPPTAYTEFRIGMNVHQ